GPDERLVPAATDNPKGFWEHGPIVELNDLLLARLGGRSMAPPRFVPGWATVTELDDLREIARLILVPFADAELWAWKDPRACLTLPFWQTVLPSMRYLICVRSPFDVARSLKDRNRVSTGRSLYLWLLYTQSVLSHTEGHSRRIVLYDRLVDEPLEELRALAGFLDVPARAGEPGVQDELAVFVDRQLRHHRSRAQVESSNPALDDLSTNALHLAERAYAGLSRKGEMNYGQAMRLLQEALEAVPPSWHPWPSLTARKREGERWPT
ncbi:MAG: hypothetical protein M3P18_07920, partial [Actinomycetota bacterium]|nr:hypothetical protein [Actinomycetota bacterium]